MPSRAQRLRVAADWRTARSHSQSRGRLLLRRREIFDRRRPPGDERPDLRRVPNPAQEDAAYPIVIIPGAAQTGTNFNGTPDGREGWAQFFLRKGYAVYIVDQAGPRPLRLSGRRERPAGIPNRRERRAPLHRAGADNAVAAGAAAHAVAGHGRAGRSGLRSVLRLAGAVRADGEAGAGAQSRRRYRAAREDRARDRDDAFAIRRLSAGRWPMRGPTGEGAGRRSNRRSAGVRHRAARRAGLFPRRHRARPWGITAIPLTYEPAARMRRDLAFVQQEKPDAPDLPLLAAERRRRGNCRICRRCRSSWCTARLRFMRPTTIAPSSI